MFSSRVLLFGASVLLTGLLVPAIGSAAHADLPAGCTRPAGVGPVPCTYEYTGGDQNGLAQAPTFTSPDTALFSRGVAGSFSVTTEGSPVSSLSVSGSLPEGLGFVDNGDGTATLSGRPTGRPGVARVRLLADNGAESASQRLTIQLIPLPGACANRFGGTAHADRLRGTAAGDRLVGRAGKDQLLGLAGTDCLFGGPGRDGLFGDAGADRLSGGPGRDVINGGPGADTIHSADRSRDVVRCGPGRDTVFADRMDVLHGCEVVRIRRSR